MYTRNKPPPIPTPNPPRSPSNKKENLDDAPVDKRRKIGVGKMVAPLSNSRSRQVLSAVNAGPVVGNGDPMPAVGSDCGSSTCGVEFNSREDVERLLGEKMKGKSKNDFKGKSEQMSEYIKKLRVCVKWFMEVEDGYLVELGKLQSTVESEEKRHTEIEAQMKSKEEKLEATVGELRRQYESLQESYRKEEAAKLATMKSYKEEMEARVAAENSRAALSEDLVKASQEAKRANDQISELQQLNKRLQEYNNSLQQYNTKLQTDNADYTKTNSMLQKEKNAMMETMTGLRAHTTLLQEQLATLRSSQQEANKQKEELKKEVCCLRSDLQQVRDDRDNQLAQVQSLTAEIAKYKEVSGKSSMDLERVMLKANVLEESCCSQREQIQLLQHQLAAANEKLKMTDLTTVEMKAEYEQQKETIINLKNHVADAKRQIHEAEELRKKLHNTIQELKGNIRVFCRVRPVLPENDFSATEGAIVSYPTSTEMLGRGIELMHQGQNHLFNFDKVFHHEASQEEVFLEISQVIQSALDGYKVCIFAYGQTGSGKTYTMMGEREPPEQKGLIPRSLEQIFQTSQSKQSQGWRFKMQASMLEIYNETIRDLLSTNDVNGIPSKQCSIKLDPNGSTHVPDLTIVDVYSSKEVSSLLRQAAQSRSVGKTQMNEQSSRSHFVFTLRISGDNESTEQHVQGVLNLIDLAGSERLSRSGATGDRLKETQAINKSLSCLSDVFLALAKKDAKKDDQHVPYRNSILTYLLKPCLGGDSKTLMFVNISPEASSAGESLCSLRFATRVNSCEIGVARRQTQPRNPDSRLSYG